MKILLTGGGSGGHVYPLFAVAQQVRKISAEKKLLQPEIYFVSDEVYDEDMIFKNDLIFKELHTGKLRQYFSIANFFDLFKTANGILRAFILMFSIYPDVIFTNGGYSSFPILLAARFFRIPVLIHVSDSVPGRVLQWASKFAKKVSIGFPEAAEYVAKSKVAYTGNPIRAGLSMMLKQGAHEFLKLDKEIPTILIIGGSQGAKMINDTIVDILPKLVEKYQVIHQTGKNNFDEVNDVSRLVLEGNKNKERYKPFKYLDLLALRMAVGASDLVISRAGSSISEIAVWELPSIIIPITNSSGNHQRKNAFSYARYNATVIIEESNLTGNLLNTEINRIMDNPERIAEMKKGAKEFSRPDAAKVIADEIIKISLKHER